MTVGTYWRIGTSIALDWRDADHAKIRSLLYGIIGLRAQEPAKQERFKLSYYVSLYLNPTARVKQASKWGSNRAEEKNDKDRFRLPKTTITSPAVRRFLLAQSVINNEPYGVLDDISVNTEGLAVIASFSEVIGLEGEVLQYWWLHEGEEVLRIRVPVRANRWRSHSTNRVYAAMKGAWRAELRDSEGTLLASIEFVS
jgi:hypothetical protein